MAGLRRKRKGERGRWGASERASAGSANTNAFKSPVPSFKGEGGGVGERALDPHPTKCLELASQLERVPSFKLFSVSVLVGDTSRNDEGVRTN